MVDRDAFLFNPFLSGNVNVYKLTPASDCVRTQPVGSDSVSYTHLDVYKRQAQRLLQCSRI